MNVPIQRAVVSVYVACFAFRDDRLQLLPVQLGADSWALPGGPVNDEERLDKAAERLLKERTGLSDGFLEQLYTFSDPERDPRGPTVSIAYYALLGAGPLQQLRAGRGVKAVAWHPVDRLPPLAFDHRLIAKYARQRLAQKLVYAPLAFWVLPKQFTLGDLRALYKAVDPEGRYFKGSFDPSNFQKQMLARWDLAPVPGSRDRRVGRPARLYEYIGSPEIEGQPDFSSGQEEQARDNQQQLPTGGVPGGSGRPGVRPVRRSMAAG